MARVPIEIVTIGNVTQAEVANTLTLANSLQNQFDYALMTEDDVGSFRTQEFRRIQVRTFFDMMEVVRTKIRGFHPYIIFIVNAPVDGNLYSNLFGSVRSTEGMAIITLANVPDIIIPANKITSYLLYYLTRYTLSFISHTLKNHDEPKACIFDRKLNKLDLLNSMTGQFLCDECRTALHTEPAAITSRQFLALRTLVDKAGEILAQPVDASKILPRVFFGSSIEGLPIAQTLRSLLQYDVAGEMWNEGTVFGLGDSTMEALERAVQTYDFGIFIFTADDELHSRGIVKSVARDNVLFEAGLFVGRLSRFRTFVVQPGGNTIELPSDFRGITTASYVHDSPNLTAALGPVAQRIREAIARSAQSLRP